MHSNAVEDYLKAIHVLQDKDGVAKTGALAERLGITAGSVTEMLKRMAAMSPPLITYRQHHGAVLTSDGRLSALAVIRRHRLLETFLHQVLKMGWESVHEEAEMLEHHLSDRLVRAIDDHLDHPRWDPHGEPIPDESGDIGSPEGIKLSALPPGKRFRVVRVDPAVDGMLAYLTQLQLCIGATGEVLSQAPFEGPINLTLDHSQGPRETAIGRSVADHIYVMAAS